MPTPKGTAG